MESKTYSAILLTAGFCLTGCSDFALPIAAPTVESEKSLRSALDTESTVVDGLASERVARRIGKLFRNVLPTLESTLQLVDRHDELPADSRVPFKPDQKSNSVEINKLLDEAIEMLGVSEVSDYRDQIRAKTQAIADSHTKIADYRRQKVSAPYKRDQNRLDKVNPFKLSQESLDEQIEKEKAKIVRSEKEIIELKRSFAVELSKIGLSVDEAGVESLLSSVSGDDIVSMAVVFDNIKHLTTQLQQLTEESGEALDVAKRYYGIYVVMVKVMDRIQKTFVSDIEEVHIPKLNGFTAQADKNVQEAKALIQSGGGDTQTLQTNIESNLLTRQTARLYIDYLKQNVALIESENRAAQRNLATAMNTYDTVKLSSDVAALMNTGRKNFDTLMRLQVPTLREFGNDAMRREFQRLTNELRSDR